MRKDTEKREVPFVPTSDHDNNVGFVDFEYLKIICPDLIKGMEKKETTKCPNCGFDFENIPPQSQLYNCDCGKSQADITKEYIRIILD